jgi:hypothetical protein
MSEKQQTRIFESRNFGSVATASRAFGDSLSRRLWLLRGEALSAEARRRTGLEGFGDPPPEPALSVLVNSLAREADLHPLGRFLMRVHLLDLLETRLRLGQAWRKQLEVPEASVIQGPIYYRNATKRFHFSA